LPKENLFLKIEMLFFLRIVDFGCCFAVEDFCINVKRRMGCIIYSLFHMGERGGKLRLG